MMAGSSTLPSSASKQRRGLEGTLADMLAVLNGKAIDQGCHDAHRPPEFCTCQINANGGTRRSHSRRRIQTIGDCMLHGHPQCRASNQVHAKARGVWILAGKNLKPLRSAGKADSGGDIAESMFSRWLADYRLSIKDLKQKLLERDAPAAAQCRAGSRPKNRCPVFSRCFWHRSISWKPASLSPVWPSIGRM